MSAGEQEIGGAVGAHGSAARERPSLAGSPPPGARRPESSCDPERPSCPPGVSHHSKLAEDSAGEATTVPCPLLTSHRAEVPGVGSVDSKTALGSQHLLQHTVGAAGRGGGSVFACLFFFFFFLTAHWHITKSAHGTTCQGKTPTRPARRGCLLLAPPAPEPGSSRKG